MQFFTAFIHFSWACALLTEAVIFAVISRSRNRLLYGILSLTAMCQLAGQIFHLAEFAFPEYRLLSFCRVLSYMVSTVSLFEFILFALQARKKTHILWQILPVICYAFFYFTSSDLFRRSAVFLFPALIFPLAAFAAVFKVTGHISENESEAFAATRFECVIARLCSFFILFPPMAVLCEEFLSGGIMEAEATFAHIFLSAAMVVFLYAAEVCMLVCIKKMSKFESVPSAIYYSVSLGGVAFALFLSAALTQLFEYAGIKYVLQIYQRQTSSVVYGFARRNSDAFTCLGFIAQTDSAKLLFEDNMQNYKRISDFLSSAVANKHEQVMYVLDSSGVCVASSEIVDGNEIIGTDISFRRYFKQALDTGRGIEILNDIYSGRLSLYNALSVQSASGRKMVLVVKTSLAELMKRSECEYLALVSPQTVISAVAGNAIPGLHLEENASWQYSENSGYVPAGNRIFCYSSASLASSGLPGWTFVSGGVSELPLIFRFISQLAVLFILGAWFVSMAFLLFHCKLRQLLRVTNRWRVNIFNSNTCGIIVTDLYGIPLDVNYTALRMLQITRNDFMADGLPRMYPDTGYGRKAVLNALSNIVKLHYYEDVIRYYSGETVKYIRYTAQPLIGQFDGEDTGIIWQLTDATNEIELKDRLYALKKRYSDLTCGISDLILVFDSSGFILESNDAATAGIIKAQKRKKNDLLPHITDVFDAETADCYMRIFPLVFEKRQTITHVRETVFNGVSARRRESLFPFAYDTNVQAVCCISHIITGKDSENDI